MDRFPNTLLLMSCGFTVALLIAIPVGIMSAVKQYSFFDHFASATALIGFSVPTFWLGLILILIFSVQLGWFPTGGMYTLGSDFSLADRIRHLILPTFTLALFSAGQYSRYLRSSMLEVLGQDYVRTAQAKGLVNRRVISGHAMKNALIPLVTVVALDIPYLFTGAILTETIFAWPGMGRLFWDAATRFDYPILMGIMFVSATLVVAFNLLADMMYAALDPRIRYE